MKDAHDGRGLSSGGAWLATLMSELRYGAVLDLVVRDGEPQRTPPPRLVRERRFGVRGGPPARERTGTGEPKLQVRECLEALRDLGCGVVARLDVIDGLPHKLTMVESPSA